MGKRHELFRKVIDILPSNVVKGAVQIALAAVDLKGTFSRDRARCTFCHVRAVVHLLSRTDRPRFGTLSSPLRPGRSREEVQPSVRTSATRWLAIALHAIMRFSRRYLQVNSSP